MSSCQNLASDPEEEKTKQLQHIQNLHAFNLFTKKHFKEAMSIFLELNTGEGTAFCRDLTRALCSERFVG